MTARGTFQCSVAWLYFYTPLNEGNVHKILNKTVSHFFHCLLGLDVAQGESGPVS